MNMELVQVATFIGPTFVLVATCTSQPVQVATCTSYFYCTSCISNCNLYRFFVQSATCMKSELIHNSIMHIIITY